MTLESISIRAFKCFAQVELGLAPLTILSGFNAAGKSTALQSVLLVAQALRVSPNSKYLPLNGPLVRLGSAGDVIARGRSEEMRFGFSGFNETMTWVFATSPSDHRTADESEDNAGSERERLEIFSVIDNGQSLDDQPVRLLPASKSGSELLGAVRDVVFLGATRISYLDVYPSPHEAEPVRGDIGFEGQYAPWWYVRTADNIVPSERRHPDDPSVTLRAQVDAWLGHLFPGAAANAEAVAGTGLSKLVFKLGRTGSWSRPANIGYGLSYAFPLIVALLNARLGQIIVVDSPEAHLHPRAQSKMGEMLAFFAASGIQVSVETHSDHVLSGVRLSVRNKAIPPAEVSIHFFSGQGDADTSGIISPLVDGDGYLSAWPEGFFDQADHDLAALVEPR